MLLKHPSGILNLVDLSVKADELCTALTGHDITKAYQLADELRTFIKRLQLCL